MSWTEKDFTGGRGNKSQCFLEWSLFIVRRVKPLLLTFQFIYNSMSSKCAKLPQNCPLTLKILEEEVLVRGVLLFRHPSVDDVSRVKSCSPRITVPDL